MEGVRLTVEKSTELCKRGKKSSALFVGVGFWSMRGSEFDFVGSEILRGFEEEKELLKGEVVTGEEGSEFAKEGREQELRMPDEGGSLASEF